MYIWLVLNNIIDYTLGDIIDDTLTELNIIRLGTFACSCLKMVVQLVSGTVCARFKYPNIAHAYFVLRILRIQREYSPERSLDLVSGIPPPPPFSYIPAIVRTSVALPIAGRGGGYWFLAYLYGRVSYVFFLQWSSIIGIFCWNLKLRFSCNEVVLTLY